MISNPEVDLKDANSTRS